MKTKNYYSLIIILLALVGCSDEDTQTVYFPQGQKTISNIFSITDDPYIIKFTAAVTGSDFATVSKVAENDIAVSFEVDLSLVDSYNQACNTNYLPMPEGSFEVPESAIIPKGKSATDSLSVQILAKDKFESFVPYLLPIKITRIQGADAYAYQQVIYIGLSGVADAENIRLYDRTDWKVVDFSTEEPGEGGGNGIGNCIIDDNSSTYWHTKWAGGEPEPPHYITIDMGESKVIHGIALMNRYFEGDWATYGHGQPKNIKISISTDGETWKENGVFSNLPHPEGQPFNKFFFSIYNEARFIKIIVTDVYGSNSTSIAEFGVF